MTDLKPGARVILANPGDFPDIGTRQGIVRAIDGWPIIVWEGLAGETRVKPETLELIQ
jgi:hypothetical protein